MALYRYQAPRLRAEPKPEPEPSSIPEWVTVVASIAIWALIAAGPGYVLVRAASDFVTHAGDSYPLGTGVNPGLDGSVD